MKPEPFIPAGVFLAVSLPVVWLLNTLDIGGDYRVWIAIGVGAIATGYAQTRLAEKAAKAAKAANDMKNREPQA